MSDVIQHNFAEIDAQLTSMDGRIGQGVQEVEALNQEMTRWAGYWNGSAHEEAMAYVNRVHSTLMHSLEAAKNYVNKARMANDDMKQQEASNAGMWGA